MTDVVLDTHAWIWWVGGASIPRLSRRAQRAVSASDHIFVSAASCVEVAWLEAAGRLELDRPADVWMVQALALPKVGLAPLTPEVAFSAAGLTWEHHDPNDRLIVATALSKRAILVSKDKRIAESDIVRVVW